MKKVILLLSLPILCLNLFSCSEQQVACTEIFAMATVTINGLQPDSHYTVRQSTGDTLHRNDKLSENIYLILDDNFQPKIRESSDNFIFHAFLGDSLIAKETYRISADKCHINVVSGKRELTLSK